MTSADPATATLTKLECHIAEPPASGYSGFESSGDIDLSSFSGTIYIGFATLLPKDRPATVHTASTTSSSAPTKAVRTLILSILRSYRRRRHTGQPYTVADLYALNNLTPATTAWVKGYIVGSAPGKSADSFTTETGANASNTNIFIAASASETDYAKCVAVQLPAGDVRTALSLQANEDILGKEVGLFGSPEKYFGMIGVKAVTEYVFEPTASGRKDRSSGRKNAETVDLRSLRPSRHEPRARSLYHQRQESSREINLPFRKHFNPKTTAACILMEHAAVRIMYIRNSPMDLYGFL